jgi:vesicle-fusing ATPase
VNSRVSEDDMIKIDEFIPPKHNILSTLIEFEVNFANPKSYQDVEEIDAKELSAHLLSKYIDHIFNSNQKLPIFFGGYVLVLKVIKIRNLEKELTQTGKDKDDNEMTEGIIEYSNRGLVFKDTIFTFSKDKNVSNIKFTNVQSSGGEFIRIGDFESLGIGGLDKEFSIIFRRAFVSRILPYEWVDQLNLKHCKGMLLYGPPGTGKTLIARQIGNMLKCHEPKIVNGPEILNKYVGESEKNIRDLFADAEKEFEEKKNDSQLHLIIFDEIDAICKQRGSTSGGTGVNDSVVNQLLSKIDGVKELNNILIIGMTNRLDLIDEALLRPGRFELKLEINLPDELGREQIFRIHTKPLKVNGKLSEDVDTTELAKRTKNYSGAEIYSVVKL